MAISSCLRAGCRMAGGPCQPARAIASGAAPTMQSKRCSEFAAPRMAQPKEFTKIRPFSILRPGMGFAHISWRGPRAPAMAQLDSALGFLPPGAEPFATLIDGCHGVIFLAG